MCLVVHPTLTPSPRIHLRVTGQQQFMGKRPSFIGTSAPKSQSNIETQRKSNTYQGGDSSCSQSCSDLIWSVGAILLLRETLLKLNMCKRGNQEREGSGNYVGKGEVDRTAIFSLAKGRLVGGRRYGGCSKIFEKPSSGGSRELQRAKADWAS